MPDGIAGHTGHTRHDARRDHGSHGAHGGLRAAVLGAVAGAAVIVGSGTAAPAAEPPAPPQDQAVADAVSDLEPAVAYALRHVGDPYALGGAGPHHWDCSGLVQQAYRRVGVRLPRMAADQYRATTRIPRSALRRGDLVFWSGNGKASGVHHVAIYMGGGRYIEAARPGTKVRISSFSRFDSHMYGRVQLPARHEEAREEWLEEDPEGGPDGTFEGGSEVRPEHAPFTHTGEGETCTCE